MLIGSNPTAIANVLHTEWRHNHYCGKNLLYIFWAHIFVRYRLRGSLYRHVYNWWLI